MKNIPLLILSATLSCNGLTLDSSVSEDRKYQEKTIPFIIEKKSFVDSGEQFEYPAYQNFLGRGKGNKDKDLGSIPLPVSAIISVIKTFKNDVCPSNKGGSFEITLKIDSSMKILGIGLSGEGGLKATIKCEDP